MRHSPVSGERLKSRNSGRSNVLGSTSFTCTFRPFGSLYNEGVAAHNHTTYLFRFVSLIAEMT